MGGREGGREGERLCIRNLNAREVIEDMSSKTNLILTSSIKPRNKFFLRKCQIFRVLYLSKKIASFARSATLSTMITTAAKASVQAAEISFVVQSTVISSRTLSAKFGLRMALLPTVWLTRKIEKVVKNVDSRNVWLLEWNPIGSLV